MIRRRYFLAGTAASLIGLSGALREVRFEARAVGGRRRPNVLVILADDLGFADLGCYGGDIATPHLDRLSGSATRFVGFGTAALCATTRSALPIGCRKGLLERHRATSVNRSENVHTL